jgi:hypothetical protein
VGRNGKRSLFTGLKVNFDDRGKCTHQSVLVPGHTSLLVGIGVGVALGRAGLAAEQTVQVGADLVGTTSLNGVALSAAGLEKLGALRRVTWSEERISRLRLGGGCRRL